ncbi:MAG: YdcF family protein [Bacteroidetes bacterium]|nr:YdcF family protein [Bacteroidota bacterium]
MFYFLSKVLYGMVAPVSIIILLLLIYLLTRIKVYVYWAFGLLLFFTNPFIAQTVMGWYEVEPIVLEKTDRFDAILVPSGFAASYKIDEQLRVNFSDGNDRMLQAIDLYKRGFAKRIIYTGGSDTIFGDYEPESKLGKEFMVKCGIPDSAIWIETKSMNTYQNAAFTAKMLTMKNTAWQQKRYLLVTSAFHMYRARKCFQKQGFEVTAYSSDLRSIRAKDTILNTLIPNYGGLQIWTYLLKEWIGLLVYAMKGYI